MADEDETPEGNEEEGLGAEGEGGLGEEEPYVPKKSRKRKLVIMIIAALLLLGGGGAAVTMLGIVDLAGITGSDPSASQDEGEEEKEKELPDEMVYYDLPEFLVNLNTAGKQTSFLKMTVTVELPKLETMSRIDSQMPRIVDSFNTYLRELRSSDLTGSAGTYRLREELLIRVNKILYPDQVTDILFKEILVQ